MRKRRSFSVGGGVLLLLLLLTINLLSTAWKWSLEKKPRPSARVFVEATGDVRDPGVYGFQHTPTLRELIRRAGGVVTPATVTAHLASVEGNEAPILGGNRVVLTSTLKKGVAVAQNRMSPYYRVTLGIPISVNDETAESLAAVPGIGPKTAEAIISARERKGGFKALKDLMSVRGISDAVYANISPYLTL